MSNLIVRNRHPLSLVDDMDRLVASFFGDDSFNSRAFSRNPEVDVTEEENRYVLTADIPGLTEKDLEIKVDDQLLTISSKKQEQKEEKKNGWLIRERKNLSFARSFTLPNDVDRDGISAKTAEGVLTVELPKSEKAKPKLIDIKRA